MQKTGIAAAVAFMIIAGGPVAGAEEEKEPMAGTLGCCRSFQNQETGQYLDDSPTHGLRTYRHNGGDSQKWTVTKSADNIWELKGLATGECLDDSAGRGLSTTTCNKSTYQRWYLQTWPDGTRIRNLATGECLEAEYHDSEQGRVDTRPCNTNSGPQSWR